MPTNLTTVIRRHSPREPRHTLRAVPSAVYFAKALTLDLYHASCTHFLLCALFAQAPVPDARPRTHFRRSSAVQ